MATKSSLSCVFYDKTLNKKVPCFIVPDKVYELDYNYSIRTFVQIVYDYSKLQDYNLTVQELVRYSVQHVMINDIYPATNETEINYANANIPNLVSDTNNFYTNELNRFEKILDMITDSDNLNTQTFYILAEFISDELLFSYCSQNDRLFMLYLSNTVLTNQPGFIPVPQMVRMTRKIFEKFSNEYRNYKIFNKRKYHEFNYISFPILINYDNLHYNVNFLIC